MRTISAWVRGGALALTLLLIGLQGASGAQNRIILSFGDSLSAAYGLQPEQGWVALLQRRLQAQGYEYRIINASVSGETSSGGLERLPHLLKLHQPAVVLLELGANDGLRGLPLQTVHDNLGRMLTLARNAGARVLLLGIRLPPNYGPRYGNGFADLYATLARQYHVPWVPFLLEGVALDPALMQADGLHPVAAGEPKVLDTVWPALVPLLKD
ncbi:MAG TPA: arylesterase [Steroidobacteraceae bacterium]|nr:arylesterase [Steroidobacteraceae bacterium]